jgi:hypothetical protein
VIVKKRQRRIRTDVAVLFVGDEAENQALLLGEPEMFFTARGYDGLPLVMVRLAKVAVERLEELVSRVRSSLQLSACQVDASQGGGGANIGHICDDDNAARRRLECREL